MNIINIRNREETKYMNLLQCTVKNKDVLFILTLSIIFLIFEFLTGRVKNFEERVFIMDLVKMPYMFIIPFFIIYREKTEKKSIWFYIISLIVFVVIAVVNKMGLSAVYYGHKYEIFESVGIESITAVVLYTYVVYHIIIEYIPKKILSNGVKGLCIGVLLIMNYISFNDIMQFNIYRGSNIYTYIMVGSMALYYGFLSEFYYRAAVMDTFLKNGMKPIAAFIVVSLFHTVGTMIADPILIANGKRAIASFVFLFGSGMFFSYIYIKTDKSIIASGTAKACIIVIFYLSYKTV
jgi:hypothetical protein